MRCEYGNPSFVCQKSGARFLMGKLAVHVVSLALLLCSEVKDIPNRKDPLGGPGTLSKETRPLRSLFHKINTAQRSTTYSIIVRS